ncbi:unnamed protein product [Nippostrongylus brasiliensis]|uniref:DUF2040 domain-containing protein n=1 Tax=Nippostrongylus brasiliensis TaxID=27835 RepID=A0A0N4XDA6_NIPBR|nr:unnamed protein product [Nippostrongylus brasiliensis]
MRLSTKGSILLIGALKNPLRRVQRSCSKMVAVSHLIALSNPLVEVQKQRKRRGREKNELVPVKSPAPWSKSRNEDAADSKSRQMTRSKSLVTIREPTKERSSTASTAKRTVVPEPIQNFVPQVTVPTPFKFTTRKTIVNTYSTKFVQEMVSRKKAEEELLEHESSQMKPFTAKIVPKSTYVPTNPRVTDKAYVEAIRRRLTATMRKHFEQEALTRRTKSMGDISGRQRQEKLDEERHRSEKFWEEKKDELNLSRLRLLSSMGSQLNIDEEIERKTAEKKKHVTEISRDYERYLAEMQQRVIERPLIMERQSIIAHKQNFARKYDQRMAAVGRASLTGKARLGVAQRHDSDFSGATYSVKAEDDAAEGVVEDYGNASFESEDDSSATNKRSSSSASSSGSASSSNSSKRSSQKSSSSQSSKRSSH